MSESVSQSVPPLLMLSLLGHTGPIGLILEFVLQSLEFCLCTAKLGSPHALPPPAVAQRMPRPPPPNSSLEKPFEEVHSKEHITFTWSRGMQWALGTPFSENQAGGELSPRNHVMCSGGRCLKGTESTRNGSAPQCSATGFLVLQFSSWFAGSLWSRAEGSYMSYV